MNHPSGLTMTAEQYLTWEERQERKHELVNGIVRAMAGASVAHNRIAGNVFFALKLRLRGSPCEAFGSDLKVRTGPFSYRYPDVTVDCGKPEPRDLSADRPTLVVEVLSPSTEWFDETAKLEEYLALETVQHVALLSQQRAFARAWTRGNTGWTTVDVEGDQATLAFPHLALELGMAEIYEGVAFADID